MMRSLVLLFLLVLCPTLAEAQPEDPTRWGFGIGFVPKFKVSNGSSVLGKLAEAMYENGDAGLDVKGSDFRIGVVRGRRLGGEWGVSYIRRSFKEESTQGAVETSCSPGSQPNSQICQTYGDQYFYNDNVVLNGIEANRLFVLGTIKKVVQIGIDLGGGIGWMNGTAIRRMTEPVIGNFTPPPANTTIVFPTNVTETEVPASTLVGVDPVPIGRAELAVGFILGNNVKVRASGGINVPGTHIFSISTTVLLP
jgi:hypothetical protein